MEQSRSIPNRVSIAWIFTCLFAVCTVSGEYTVEIRLHNFSNPSSLLADGECCDYNITLGDGSCVRSGCDNYFHHCLKPLGSTGSACTAGSHSGQTSMVNYNDALLNFTKPRVLGLPNPLPLPGLTRDWNGIQFLLQVFEYDRNEIPKLIQRVTYDIPYGSLLVGVENDPIRFSINDETDRASVVLSFEIACAENFYGVDCSRSCNKSDCSGNGQCRAIVNSNDFACVCDPGFTGETCDVNIDECETMNIDCNGNGQCLDGTNNFTCNCDAGFTGEQCEVNIDNCESIDNPCNWHGHCVDHINDISCICEAGYTGKTCEENINDCVGVDCSEHGHCVDGVNNYNCVCEAGYTGANCAVDINDCVGVDCSEHGQCVDGVNDHTCICEAGYTGASCAVNINECETMNIDCSGKGVCVDGVHNYSCVCDAGFTGANCGININECKTMNIDCNRKGACMDGINDFSCICESGYTGRECEINIDDCTGITCNDQGQCQDGVNDYTCVCNPGFTGQNCNVNINECETMRIDCNGQGQCLDGINEFTCRCNSGFTGKECEININDCIGVSCSEHGQCMDAIYDYVCTCDPGYTGKNCEVDINECEAMHIDCSGRGQCRDDINSYTCVCDPGYTGSDCEVHVNECEAFNVICSGHGRCVDNVNSYYCVCNPGFTGATCNQAVVADEGLNSRDKDLLELEVIGGVFTGMVAFGLILIIVFGILIAIVAKSKRSRKGNKVSHPAIGPYDDLDTTAIPRTISSKQKSADTKTASIANQNRRLNDYGQWHKITNPIYRDPSIKRTPSLSQTTSSIATSEPIFDDAIYISVPISTAHSMSGVGISNGDRTNSLEYRLENPIYGSVNDTLNNGCNVLHSVGGTGGNLLQNGQLRSMSQVTV